MKKSFGAFLAVGALALTGSVATAQSYSYVDGSAQVVLTKAEIETVLPGNTGTSDKRVEGVFGWSTGVGALVEGSASFVDGVVFVPSAGSPSLLIDEANLGGSDDDLRFSIHPAHDGSDTIFWVDGYSNPDNVNSLRSYSVSGGTVSEVVTNSADIAGIADIEYVDADTIFYIRGSSFGGNSSMGYIDISDGTVTEKLLFTDLAATARPDSASATPNGDVFVWDAEEDTFYRISDIRGAATVTAYTSLAGFGAGTISASIRNLEMITEDIGVVYVGGMDSGSGFTGTNDIHIMNITTGTPLLATPLTPAAIAADPDVSDPSTVVSSGDDAMDMRVNGSTIEVYYGLFSDTATASVIRVDFEDTTTADVTNWEMYQ